MSLESIISIGITLITIVCAPVIYMAKTFMQRIDTLEKNISNKMDEASIRILIADKIEPLHEDLVEVKSLLNKILEIQLQDKSGR